MADGTLRAVALRGSPMLVPLVLVHSRSKIFSPLQEKVIGHIREELANMGCTVHLELDPTLRPIC